MGKFFIYAGIVVLALVLAPVVLLSLRDKPYPPGGVVLHNSYGAKVKSIDPATCGDTTSAAVQGNVYEGLFDYHYLKRPVELIPQLAAAMPEISDDGSRYTIRLKPGIRYARNECFGLDEGGQPKTRTVRAEDFVLALKRIADFHIQTSLSWSFLSTRTRGLDDFRKKSETYRKGDFSRYDLEVEGLRAVDELTLEIELSAPYPQLTHILALNNYAPIPRELIDYHLCTKADGDEREEIPIEERTPQITKHEQTVGTGPYVLTVWERGSRMVFTRNPEYKHGFYPTEGAPGDAEAGLLADAGKPIPFIDVLDYKCVMEALPGWMRFLSRQSDVSGIPREVFDGVITPDRNLSESWKRKGIRLVTYNSPVVYWLAFNMQDPVFKASRSLRQGLCLAFNVEDYIDVLHNGRGVRAVNILPQSFPTHAAAGPGPYCRLDPNEAAKKLEDAKGELGRAGLLDSDGQIPEIVLDLGGRDEYFRRMGEFIKQQFEPVGLRIKIELNDWPTLQQKVHNKQTQLYTMGWHADQPDAENFLQLYYTPNIEKGTNNSNYSNPEFDALYDRIKVMDDSPERSELYVRMVRMLGEDCPILLLSEPVAFVLVYDWVKSYKRHPFGYGMTKYTRIDANLRRQMGGP